MNSVNVNSNSSTADREERNAHVAKTTHDTILTTLDDTVDTQLIDHVPTYITPAHVGLDPYADQGLTEVLGRLYKLKTTNWTSTDGIDQQLMLLSFPSDLMNTTINDRLVHFKYFRAAVEVTFRLNSTMFHRGLLQIAYLPHWGIASKGPTKATFNPFNGVFSESRLPNVIMSANTAEAVTFVIPYVAPSPYWDMTNGDNEDQLGFFGYVSVRVLIPLACGQNTLPIELSAYARFLQPEVAGPIHYQSDLTGTELKTFSDNSETGEAESADKATPTDVKREQEARSESGTQDERKQAKKNTSGATFIRTLGYIAGKFVDSLPNYIRALTPIAFAFLDMPTSTVSHEPLVIRSGSNFCATKGVDQSMMMSLDPDNRVATDHRLFVDQADYNNFANYKLLPSLLTEGSFDTTKASGDVIFTFPVNPMYVYNQPGTGVQFYYPTHLSTLTSLFRAWRGDIKYRIYFSCSHFVSARLRIEWLPTVVSTTSITGEMQGNNVNKVVDINGDTIVDFDIPYLQNYHWLQVSDYEQVRTSPGPTSNGCFRFTIVNKIVSANSNTLADPIYFAIWISGGEDFQVAYPIEMTSSTPGSYTFNFDFGEEGVAPVTFQSKESTYFDTRQVFRSPFQGLVGCRSTSLHGYENGESVSSFTEYLKRYTAAWNMTPTNLNYITIPSATDSVTPNFLGPFANFAPPQSVGYRNSVMVLNNFLFHRGSVRYKLVDTVQSSTPSLMSITTMAYGMHTPADVVRNSRQEGTFFQNMQLNPVLEFQIPFWYPYPFYSLNNFTSEKTTSPGFIVYNNSSTAQTLNQFRALGDDYCMAWPMGCPSPITFTPS